MNSQNNTNRKNNKSFAIIGGGRWARVYASSFSSINPSNQVIIVSNFNADQLANKPPANNLKIVRSLNDLFSQFKVDGAIVANAARLHYNTASSLTDAGICTLIEKPIAINVVDVENLYRNATRHKAFIAPSLTYLRCSYLNNFSEIIKGYSGQIIKAQLEWCDPKIESRYNEKKTYDPSISIAQDVMPHVWSIFTAIFGRPNKPIYVDSCDAKYGGRSAIFKFQFQDVYCESFIERESSSRERRITIELESQKHLEIDFSKEPGVISEGSNTISGDHNWDQTLKPVTRELLYFIEQLNHPSDHNLAFQKSVGSVALAESADSLLKQQQRSWLKHQYVGNLSDDTVVAIRDIICSELYNAGEIVPGNHDTLNKKVEFIIRMISSNKHTRKLDWMSALQSIYTNL